MAWPLVGFILKCSAPKCSSCVSMCLLAPDFSLVNSGVGYGSWKACSFFSTSWTPSQSPTVGTLPSAFAFVCGVQLPNILRPFTCDPHCVPSGGASSLISAPGLHVALPLIFLGSCWPQCLPLLSFLSRLPTSLCYRGRSSVRACHPRTSLIPGAGSSHHVSF